jgi:CHAT domain-containing protein
LAETAAPPQPRIWWYLTGPLTFIPIHAAGPGSDVIDVSRLVISSYVTTLQSLFQAQNKRGPVSEGQRKFLSISLPETPGQSSLLKTMVEVNVIVQVFCLSGWPFENIILPCRSEAMVEGVSCVLDSCSWIHFACHGTQHPKIGMRTLFALHDGLLELGDITSKKLSRGQFALLSACHSASGLRDLPREAMHLTAGV